MDTTLTGQRATTRCDLGDRFVRTGLAVGTLAWNDHPEGGWWSVTGPGWGVPVGDDDGARRAVERALTEGRPVGLYPRA